MNSVLKHTRTLVCFLLGTSTLCTVLAIVLVLSYHFLFSVAFDAEYDYESVTWRYLEYRICGANVIYIYDVILRMEEYILSMSL